MTEWSPEELVTAYVDGELESDAQRRQVEAQLESSVRWRRQAQLERVLRRSLRHGVPGRAPVEVRDAVESMMSEAKGRAWTGWLPTLVLAACALIAVGMLVSRIPMSHEQADTIPMVEAVVEDYAARVESPLPDRRGMETHPTWAATASLRKAGARFVSGWRVHIRGEGAIAYAFVWKEQLVVQYVVSRELFLRQQVVRDAIDSTGAYTTEAQGHGVAGWLDGDRGTLVVGLVEPDDLLEVWQS